MQGIIYLLSIKKDITKILFDQGYILSYKFEETTNKQGIIKIALKYDKFTKEPVIKKLQRMISYVKDPLEG